MNEASLGVPDEDDDDDALGREEVGLVAGATVRGGYSWFEGGGYGELGAFARERNGCFASFVPASGVSEVLPEPLGVLWSLGSSPADAGSLGAIRFSARQQV